MTWLIACEESGIVRDAFIRNGIPAISCDLLDTSSPGPHIKGDVSLLLKYEWEGIIAHPPCDFLANSGARWRAERDWEAFDIEQAAWFFRECLEANAKYIAVENPVMAYPVERVGRKPDFTCQPWQFGDNFKKRTCFWTKNLPKLIPTSDLDGSTAIQAVWKMAPSPERKKLRSRTYPGLADAMAKQWGGLSKEKYELTF